MSTITLPVSIIDDVEKKLQAALEEVRALKKIQTKKKRAEEPSKYLIKAMKQAEKDWKSGNVSPAFDNAEDAIAWLHKSKV